MRLCAPTPPGSCPYRFLVVFISEQLLSALYWPVAMSRGDLTVVRTAPSFLFDSFLPDPFVVFFPAMVFSLSEPLGSQDPTMHASDHTKALAPFFNLRKSCHLCAHDSRPIRKPQPLGENFSTQGIFTPAIAPANLSQRSNCQCECLAAIGPSAPRHSFPIESLEPNPYLFHARCGRPRTRSSDSRSPRPLSTP